MAKKKHYSSKESMSKSEGSFANMPQESKQHAWGLVMEGFDCDIDDTIKGADAQINADLGKLRKIRNPQKW